jgi:Na+-driven multidrug efflux pump
MGTYDLYWYDDATYQAGIHYYYPHTREIKHQWAFKVCLIYCILLFLVLPLGVALHQRRRKRKQQRMQDEILPTTTAADKPHHTQDDTELAHQCTVSDRTTLYYEMLDRSQSAPERIVEAMVPQEVNLAYDTPSIASTSGWTFSFLKPSNNNPLMTKIPEATTAHAVSNPYFNVESVTESSSSTNSGTNSSSENSPHVLRASGHAALTSVGSNNDNSPHQKMPQTIDLCLGERPWYCYYFSRSFWRKVKKCAQWDAEMENILSLALPYTVRTIIENVFSLLEAGVIGRFLGTSSLTAYYIVDMGVGFATMFLHGMLSSLTVLVSHAIGAENYTLAGIYVQLSVWTHQILFLPILIVGWSRFFHIVLLLGFDEEIAVAAHEYARFAMLEKMVGVYDTALHYVLGVAGHEKYSTGINGVHSVLSFVYVLIVAEIGEGTKLSDVGLIHLKLTVLFSLINVAVIVYKRWFSAYWRAMLWTNPFRELRPIKTFLRAAVPLSIGYVIEYCEWDVLFIFAALQGPAEVAVWGLLGQIWDVMDDIVLAVSDASEVRVAHLLGLGKPSLAKHSSDKSLLLAMVSGFIMSAVLASIKTSLPRWLTNDGILQRMLTNLMPIICLALAVLSFGSMSYSILCAQGRTPLATTVSGFGSLFITLPLASLSTFYFNFNLQGLASCLLLGYASSGFVNSLLMLTANWKRVSRTVRKRTKQLEENMRHEVEDHHNKQDAVFVCNGVRDSEEDQMDKPEYDSYDFDELPVEVKAAAVALGYNQVMWDQGLEIEALNVYWDQLSPEKQRAAATLGYDKDRWNAS